MKTFVASGNDILSAGDMKSGITTKYDSSRTYSFNTKYDSSGILRNAQLLLSFST